MTNSNKVKIPYALDAEKKLVHINDVKNGIKCNCFCTGCGEKLIAKNKGSIKQPHFAHYDETNCATALQSTLHYLAKEIFLERKEFRFKGWDGITRTYHITEVFLEKKFGDVIPDVVLNCDGKIFFVEIFVTHHITEEKKQKLKEMNVSVVEYDLSKIDRNIDKESLKDFLFGNPEIRWSYDADFKRFYQKQEYIEKNGKRIIARKGIVICPFTFKNVEVKNRYSSYSYFIDIPKVRIRKDFCKNCIFYSGENKKHQSFCGVQLSNNQDFNFTPLIGRYKLLEESEFEKYWLSFLNSLFIHTLNLRI